MPNELVYVFIVPGPILRHLGESGKFRLLHGENTRGCVILLDVLFDQFYCILNKKKYFYFQINAWNTGCPAKNFSLIIILLYTVNIINIELETLGNKNSHTEWFKYHLL